ncbi:MAG: class IV adenylate cyclase [bacterium]|nr:class IV adenylate cyclase [bacterium]
MEVEIRIKILNIRKTQEKLKNIGAKFSKKIKVYDRYFGAVELYKKIGYSFLVRIRESNNDYFLAVKSAKKKIEGCWEEYEIKIKTPKIYLEMLKTMGFENIIDIKKIREEYKLNNIKIMIDKFENYGNFLEIEVITEKPDKSILFNIFKKMGVKKENIIEKGYISLFLEQASSPFAKYIKH